MSKSTITEFSNLIVRHTIHSYIAITQINIEGMMTRSKSKIQSSQKISLEDYLNDKSYYPSISDDSFLNEFKIYASFNRDALVKYLRVKKSENIELENLNFIENTDILLEMNHNIDHQNSNDASVISNIIMVNKCLGDQIGYYLVLMNIHMLNKYEKIAYTKGLITRYLNSLILSNERSIVIRVVSIIHMIKNYFDDIEKNINKGVHPKYKSTKYFSFIGKYLRAYEVDYESQDSKQSISIFLNDMKRELKNYAIDEVADFNKKYFMWRNILKNIKRDVLIENLSSQGFNKTCLYLLEDFVNSEMIESKMKSIDEYQNEYFVAKYYQCFSKIDENDFIMKNYVISDELNKKLKKFKEEYSDYNIGKLNQLSDEFFCKLDYDTLDEESKFIYSAEFKLPPNLYFERVVLGFILKMHKIMGISKLEKFKRESFILMDGLKVFINKLYYENEKLYGHFYQNKIYYELLVIFESIIKESIQKIITITPNIRIHYDLYNPTFYKSTIKQVEDLYRTRRLEISTNNLLHFKIRRLMCKLFKLKEVEQSMIKNIMKIYKIINDSKNITQYLQEFSKNFELDSSRSTEFYTILKFNLNLEKFSVFNKYYDTYSSKFGFEANNNLYYNGINLKLPPQQTKEKYKFYLLKIQSLIHTHLSNEVIEDLVRYLGKKGLWDNILDEIFNCGHSSYLNKYAKKDLKIQKLSQNEINEFCNVTMAIIDCIIKELNTKSDSSYTTTRMTDAHRLMEVTKYMIAVCTLTSEKKILFKISPIIINNLLKLEKITGLNPDLRENVNSLIDVLLTWQEEKVYFIVPQLIMISTETESNFTQASIKILSKYVEIFPHINGFWLASFLNTDVSDFTRYEKLVLDNRLTEDDLEIIKKAYENRLKFGKKICDNLKKISKDIIYDYKEFTSKLVEIHRLIKHEDANKLSMYYTDDKRKHDIKSTIKKINEWIEKGKRKILLPKLKNMSRKIEFSDEENHEKSDKVFAYQSLQVIPDFDESIRDENRTRNKYVNEKINFGIIENSSENFITRMSEHYQTMSSKDKPAKITFYTKKDGEDIKHHFILKGGIEDSISEVKALEVLNSVNNIFKYEGLDTNYGMNVKQYNFVPISPHKLLIEWMDKMETLFEIFEKVYTKFGIDEELDNVAVRDQKNISIWCKKMGLETNKLYEHFMDEFVDPNKWYENKLRYITSTAIWSMVGYVIGLGDRHTQNIMISSNYEICHIDFGYMLGLQRKLGVPEIVDFRFTKNIRRALGIFEEQGYFLFIAKEALKALFKHFDSIETRLIAFISDPLIKKRDR